MEESAGGPDSDDSGHLQRDEGRVRPVTRRSLIPFARDAAHLDRLLADTDLFERLRENDFSGPDWDYVAVNALIRYGRAVLVGWMRSGEIWVQLAQQRGIRGLPEPPTWEWAQQATWETIADDTLMVAVEKFRDTVLRTGYWTPRRGASLRTFFIGQCLIRFPNIYRSWATEVRRRYEERPGDAEDWLYALSNDQLTTEARVTLQDQVMRELGCLDERTRRVLELREAGYDQYEIAERLGLNRKIVENAVARQARRGRRRRGA